MTNKPLKANKGEWSELYVFTTLLATGKLFQSDITLDYNPENYYQVIGAFKENFSVNHFYRRNTIEETIEVFSENDPVTFKSKIPISYFEKYVEILLTEIKLGVGNSFEIEKVNSFIETLGLSKIKEKAGAKSDIKLKIYDHRLAKEADLGFSVKSLLGSESTLFNTGTGNNFIYSFEKPQNFNVDEFNVSTYKPKGGISKLTARLHKLKVVHNFPLSFDGIESQQLWKNLKMVDGDLPEILAFALLYRWIEKKNSLWEIVKILEEKDPLNFYAGEVSLQKLYEYKLKKFLVESALGMTSETPWHGIYDATGGAIIVKKNGAVVCFHIYDLNLLREYLIKNTFFEQAATGEDGERPGYEKDSKKGKKYFYGWLYDQGDKLSIKINLQVRFKQ